MIDATEGLQLVDLLYILWWIESKKRPNVRSATTAQAIRPFNLIQASCMVKGDQSSLNSISLFGFAEVPYLSELSPIQLLAAQTATIRRR